ncbi:MAG TPA: hypothetical protein VGE74_14570 [Gemmata sp.]
MLFLLRKLGARLFGSKYEIAKLRKQLVTQWHELDATRHAKDKEVRGLWEHAHKLDAALQRLDGLYRAARSGTYDFLTHSFGTEAPTVPSVIVPDLKPTEGDVRIADRLLRAYRRAAEEERRRGEAQAKPLPAEFSRALQKNDPAELAAYLCNMGRQEATTGITQGNPEHDKIASDRAHRDRLALRLKDRLLSLAELVGAVACENPDQGPWGQALHRDIDTIAEAVAGAFGIDIAPPPIDGGLLKVPTARGLFCEHDCQGLATAWRLRQLLGPLAGAAVCEIGAGAGRAAYWSRRLGCDSYTAFALPHVNVLQGFYLLKALGEEGVFLYGERPAPEMGGGVSVLPDIAMDRIPPRSFDLVLNQGSFPETSPEVVRGHLEWTRAATKRYFYSLNHEGGSPRVSELVTEAGGFRRVSRAPDWMRRGGVVELYAVEG